MSSTTITHAAAASAASSPTTRLLSVLNVSLSELPIRPSSLTWWNQKGIYTTQEVQQSFVLHANASLIQWTTELRAPSLSFLVSI
jgi:hypothetical protein